LIPLETSIRLIVGLGNPGEKYAATRHNAGAWFVERLADAHQVKLKLEPKFHGQIGAVQITGQRVWLLLPTTFMNASGQSVRAFCQFYQIPPEAILVAHDELDFSPGVVRIKQEGGHGGHNGLRDIIAHLHTDHFSRLRIGIGHPGHRDQVLDYVLNNPSKKDYEEISQSFQQVIEVLPDLVEGDVQKAIRQLHSV
jgi:PTH1 family peptidyl-tRNA hydrolase